MSWQGASRVASVKVAVSTSSQPAAGTGTAATGSSGILDCGAFLFTDTLYVTITPYSGVGATGLQGLAYQYQTKFPVREDVFTSGTGAPKRASPFDDGKYALLAADAVGTTFAARAITEVANAGREDKIINGDFEDGSSWWRSDVGTVTIDTGADRYKGDKSIKLVGTAIASGQALQCDDGLDVDFTGGNDLLTRVTPGEILRLRAACKVVGGTAGIAVFQYNDTKDTLAGPFTDTLQWTETSWTEKEEYFTVPAGCYYIALQVHSAVNNTAWFDELHCWRVKQSQDLQEGLFNIGDKSSSFSVDWANGRHQRVRLTGNIATLTQINGRAGVPHKLEIQQDGTGSRTVGWATDIHWPAGTAPTLTTTINRVDVFNFLYDNIPGTPTYRGSTEALNYVD